MPERKNGAKISVNGSVINFSSTAITENSF